jgi:hypothetical protein
VEAERRLQPRDERIERIKNGIEHNETTDDKDEVPVEEEVKDEKDLWEYQLDDDALKPSWY